MGGQVGEVFLGKFDQCLRHCLAISACRHGEGIGFVKLISDAKYGELLGAHLIGPEVTELLPELTLAQKWELTAEEVARNVHAHPTLSETIKEAAHGLIGHMLNA